MSKNLGYTIELIPVTDEHFPDATQTVFKAGVQSFNIGIPMENKEQAEFVAKQFEHALITCFGNMKEQLTNAIVLMNKANASLQESNVLLDPFETQHKIQLAHNSAVIAVNSKFISDIENNHG